MEAHLAPKPSVQVNKIASSCEICGGPHDTQYCMKNPEQAFVDYASSHTDEARGKWFTFKLEQNTLGDTYNPSWRSHPNLRWMQPQNSQNNFSNPPNRFQPNGLLLNCTFNNNPQNFSNQSNLEGLVSNFMASQDAQLSKFEADFKQQQSKITNKIDTFLKAINDRMTGELPSDTVKNPKLNVNSTSLVSSARSYPMEDPQSSSNPFNSLKIRSLEETENVIRLADGSKSYPIGIVRNVEELEDMIDMKIDWNKPPKEGDDAWHIRIELIDLDGEKFDRVFQTIPTSRKRSENEKPSDILDLEHFYDV
ncbi:hypothetical protein Tco_0948176 [Tanacetum coccineum]